MITKMKYKYFEYNDFFEEWFIKEEFYDKHKKIMSFLEYINNKFVL